MEQKKMSKVYAVDFDGTLCDDKWPEIGEPNKELIDYLVGCRQQGEKVILWTCRKVGADVYIDDRAWNPITGGNISNMAAGERGSYEGAELAEEIIGWKKQMMRTFMGGERL